MDDVMLPFDADIISPTCLGNTLEEIESQAEPYLYTYDGDPKVKPALKSVQIPNVDSLVPSRTKSTTIPDTVQALYQRDVDLHTHNQTPQDYYSALQIQQISADSKSDIRAHVDGGAMTSTTHNRSILWNCALFQGEAASSSPRLKVADATIHRPIGEGYLKIPGEIDGTYCWVKCYHTPGIPATIVSPDAIAKATDCTGYTAISDFSGEQSFLGLNLPGGEIFRVPLIRHRGLLFTMPCIPPAEGETADPTTISSAQRDDNTCLIRQLTDQNEGERPAVQDISALTRDQQRMLWHFRLGHIHENKVTGLHKYVDGIPTLPKSDAITKCAICSRTKLHKASRVDHEEDK